jgi:hypothetical protein
LSENEDDMRDKLQPSISYLQKLGPEHLDQIFQSSRWVFEEDRDIAFEIFTSEDVELPRNKVADFLETVDPSMCAKYLEYLIEERSEEEVACHDRLAELYLSMTLNALKRGDEGKVFPRYKFGSLMSVKDVQKGAHYKLLKFISENQHFRIDRLYGKLSSESAFQMSSSYFITNNYSRLIRG